MAFEKGIEYRPRDSPRAAEVEVFVVVFDADEGSVGVFGLGGG